MATDVTEIEAGASAESRAVTICFASPKGGVGKTSSCLALIGAIHQHNPAASIYAIDLDRQYSMVKFFQSREKAGRTTDRLKLSYVESVQQLDANEAHERVTKAKAENDFVLIDTAGKTAAETLYFCFHSDIVIIPTDLCVTEFRPGLMFYSEFVAMMNKIGTPITTRFLFTKHSANIVDTKTKAVRKYIVDSGLPLFDAELHSQFAYKHLEASGLFIHEQAQTEPGRAGHRNALREINALCDEILRIVIEVNRKAA